MVVGSPECCVTGSFFTNSVGQNLGSFVGSMWETRGPQPNLLGVSKLNCDFLGEYAC